MEIVSCRMFSYLITTRRRRHGTQTMGVAEGIAFAKRWASCQADTSIVGILHWEEPLERSKGGQTTARMILGGKARSTTSIEMKPGSKVVRQLLALLIRATSPCRGNLSLAGRVHAERCGASGVGNRACGRDSVCCMTFLAISTVAGQNSRLPRPSTLQVRSL